MNNKSFYAVIAFVAIVDMILVIKPNAYGLLATRSILCGGALYYIVQLIKEKKKVNVYLPFMVIFAILFNPVVPFFNTKDPSAGLPEWVWLVLDIAALSVFYFLSRSIELPDGTTHNEIFPNDKDNTPQ